MAWKTVRADEFCSFVTDGTHDSPKPQSQGRKLITSKHLKGDHIDFDSANWISEGDYQKIIARSAVEQWDILFSMIGTIGTIYLEKSPIVEYACKNMGVFKFAGNAENAFWMYYYLKSPQAKEYIQSHLRGSTQAYVPLGSLREMPVSIPDRETRNRIVSLLKPLDEKIATNRAINDNLYEMVNAYYTSLFKDVECEMTTIGNYAERIYSGGTPTTSNVAYWDGTFGWLSSGETRNRFVISTEKSITQTGIDNSSTKLASKHDIVMASAGQGFTRGQTSMLLIDTYVNQSVIVIHADRNILPYLFWNLANRYEELRAISDSSSIRGSLTTKMIAAFEIPLANNDVIQTFSDFAWAVIPQIENNLLENERLAALRDSLLPKFMSGEIDVSDVQL